MKRKHEDGEKTKTTNESKEGVPSAHQPNLGNTDLFMGRENGEPRSCRLVLLGSAKGPESNGATAKLCEPALELGLGGVVGETRHVQNLASLR